MKCTKVIDILKQTAQRYPQSVAVIDPFGKMTYAELLSQVSRYIESLSPRVKKGSHVGVCLQNSREFIAMLFAASACDLTVIPLGNNLSRAEVEAFAEDLDIDYLIQHTSSPLDQKRFWKGELIADEIVLKESSVPTAQHNYPDAAFIRPTSGTTGAAKGVVFLHSTIIERVDNALKGLQLDHSDKVLWVLPMAYHFIVSIFLYVRAGATVILPKNADALDLIELANTESASVIYAGPLHYALLSEDQGDKKLPPMKWCISTAGGVSPALAKKFEERHLNPLRQVYGIIEVGLPVGNLSKIPAPAGSIGQVQDGFEVSVQDEGGNILGPGQTGELLIRGNGLFEGYYKPYLQKDYSLEKEWFRTGDLVSFDKENNYYIAGRKKSMHVVAGNKVFSEEVERVLNEHPAVAVSKVFSTPHELVGESLSAHIQLKENCNVVLDEVKKFCKKRLSGYKVPQNIAVVETIPLTPTGKVIRSDW